MVRKPNFMTVPAALKELDKIELIKQPKGNYKLDHAITKTQKTILGAFGIDEKITLCEEKLRKLKERCDSVSKDLDRLYSEKKKMETQEPLSAIEGSSRTRAEILAFLGSHA